MNQAYLKERILKLSHQHQDKTKKLLARIDNENTLEHIFRSLQILKKEHFLDDFIILSLILYHTDAFQKQNTDNISEEYGHSVWTILTGLHKISQLRSGKVSIHTDNFRKLYLSFAGDIRVILIKLAENLHFIQNIQLIAVQDKPSFLNKIQFIFIPIAHRLGLYKIKTEMEDLWLKYSNPSIHYLISRRIAETEGVRNEYIRSFIQPLEKELEKQGFDCHIFGRPKSVYSIHKKMQNKKVGFDEVYDLFAIRIIINKTVENEKADCWKIYSIITNLYQPEPLRLRDWISKPKDSGYESLHTTVLGPKNRWIEVQIRTKRMDEIAEKGEAAHWKYKENNTQNSQSNLLQGIRSTLEKGIEDKDENLAIQISSEDIFVFTPKGDIKKLPKNAGVLDFAFQVHTKVGEKCAGAIVNGRNVPIKHQLQNGDEVEIITSTSQKPRMHWLKLVQSNKVKQRIRRSIQTENQESVFSGKQILEKKCRQYELEMTDKNLTKIRKFFGVKYLNDLYTAIDSQKIDLQKYFSHLEQAKKEEIKEQTKENLVEKINQSFADPLVIDETTFLKDYSLAKCCQPSYGQDVFGFVTVSKGIKIHKKDCTNAKDLQTKYPYRIIPAKWIEKQENKTYSFDIKLQGINRKGIVQEINRLLNAEPDVEINAINFKSHENKFLGEINLSLKYKKSLKNIIEKLKRIPDISTVK